MDVGVVSVFSIYPILLLIIYGLFVALGLTVLYLLIKFLIRAIAALDIYLEEKGHRRR